MKKKKNKMNIQDFQHDSKENYIKKDKPPKDSFYKDTL